MAHMAAAREGNMAQAIAFQYGRLDTSANVHINPIAVTLHHFNQ
jgi:hypothetical protein